jgi:hypothetical protein
VHCLKRIERSGELILVNRKAFGPKSAASVVALMPKVVGMRVVDTVVTLVPAVDMVVEQRKCA